MNIFKRALLTLPQRIYSYCNVSIAPITSRNFHLVTSATNTIKQAKSFLEPSTNLVAQVAGFKVKGHLKRRCKDCYFVMRQQRLYVICKTHPRHKQMAMKARDYKSWILTHATQSKIRPY